MTEPMTEPFEFAPTPSIEHSFGRRRAPSRAEEQAHRIEQVSAFVTQAREEPNA
jgi:hypothetical protein